MQMKVTPYKTHKVSQNDTSLLALLDRYLPDDVPERSVIAVSSKIVAICEGRVVKIKGTAASAEGFGEPKEEELHRKEKDVLISREAEWYLPSSENPYGVSITIKNNVIIASAGIDESNADGKYVLWPKNPQKSANTIRVHIVNRLSLREVGVIITDSRLSPLRWGVTGVGIAHSGFRAVNDLIGKPDIFGRPLHVTKVNVLDGLAASAVFVMGESNEQTPIAVLSDIPHIVFQDHNPTEKEVAMLKISMEEDIFSPILKKAPWKKGRG
ncbi:MAG: coenzyme F420-0:L-glutamate ligase [bacterium]|nr:coenzyme F420-0:L-glutamate ligase [bacterium]